MIPKIAKEFGIKTLVGAWIGDDPEKNEAKLEEEISQKKRPESAIVFTPKDRDLSPQREQQCCLIY